MATDIAVVLENRPGSLAQLGETLGAAGVNVDGGCAVAAGGEGEVHILVQDAAAARKALEGAGIAIRGEREVLVVPVEDRPGELGAISRPIADAGVNIDLFYLTAQGQLVLGVNDLEKARRAL